MTSLTTQQLKRMLLDAGFEVFRTKGEEILLSERVRENLIMDSGVRIGAGSPLCVKVVLRAQKADFPSEDESLLFARARRLAEPARAAGFSELGTSVTPVTDPGDSNRTLDTFYEVVFGKNAATVEDAMALLKFALSLEKRA